MSVVCSIIIVNWKSLEYLKQCLKSVEDSNPSITYEVIVIDNASYDGSDELMREYYPHFRFIQSERNLGFAGANNLAANESNGALLFFLNPDTVIRAGALDSLCRSLLEMTDAGIAGAKLFNSDESIQVSCILQFPTILNQVFDVRVAKSVLSYVLKNEVSILNQQSTSPVTVEAVSGAALLIKKDVFTKVGGFSSEYFMYSEDVDLCKKVMCEGLRVILVPESKIVHYGGGASSKQSFSLFGTVLQRESILVYMKKFSGVPYAVAYRITIGLVAAVRLSVAIAILPLFLLFRKRYAISFYKKWFHILKWSLGLQFWARNDKLLKTSR